MVNKEWEFLEGKEVYLYPSSNADDGGDVNSEKNLSEISHKFTNRNFVIRRSKDDEPLKVTFSSKSTIHIADGEAVIEGYYASIKSKGEGSNTTFIVSNKHVPSTEFNSFIGNYITVFKKLYEYETRGNDIIPRVDADGNWIPKKVSKQFKKDNPLPCLHVIIKLLKNTTGNLRGDLTERNHEDPSLTYRICKGLAISVCTEHELELLDSPYIDLAWIYIEPTKSNITIHHIVNDNSRYTYIDEDSIISEDGMTIREWVEYYVKDQLGSLDTLTHINKEASEPYKDTTLSVSPDDIKVTRLELKQPPEYDDEGNPVVESIDDFNKTYSIDNIQRRTHVTSASEKTDSDDGDEKLNSKIAPQVDERDDGEGSIEVYQSDNTKYRKTRNINGKSRLLARGDHTHDGRYIYTKDATNKTDIVQQISTSLAIGGGLNVEGAGRVGKYLIVGTFKEEDHTSLAKGVKADNDGNLKATGKATILGGLEVENGATVNGDTVINNGNLVVAGTITGSKVYNAVWNDYAELFKKKDKGQVIEPGTVICKVPGEDTYCPSAYDNRNLVVGVCSDSYGCLLGGDSDKTEEENLKDYIPVALAGRVYVKVDKMSVIQEGDLLTVGLEDGRARRAKSWDSLTGVIIGKALESTYGNKDKILMIVTLR